MGVETVAIEIDNDLAALLRQPDRSVRDSVHDLIVTALYRRGGISRGKAAELLGMPLDAFLRHASSLGIPYVAYSEAEWAAEKRSVQEMAASLRPSATPVR